ncbi:MAG: 23S rRNA (uracil(1939)-C(5))-methyltransferase RlmD [Pseudomonadota bacterium]
MSKSRRRREPYSVAIENLSHEGRGVGRVNGKTVFVAGGLPGEQVLAQKTRGRKSFDEAIALEVENPNPHRVNPECAHYAICGGCSLQHLASDQQIAHKQAVLLELFQHHAGVACEEVLAPIQASPWQYRRRARLGVKFVEKKGGVLVGFREKSSPYIADINRCEVLHPSIGDILLTLRKFIAELSIKTKVPQLEIAVGDEHTAIILRHLEPFSPADEAVLASFQTESGLSLFLQPGGEDTVHPLNQNSQHLSYGIDDIQFHFSPSNFIQVNQAINQKMISAVMSHLALEPTDRVLDLFCGLGNFTLPIAKKIDAIHGVEGDDQLVELALSNAKKNEIGNATFEKMNLADPTELQGLALQNFNKLILDPPRTGAEDFILNCDIPSVRKIAYVSCNPVTLARDAGHLITKYGFKLTKLGVMDMFPHTSHVESLAIFTR